MPTGDGPDAVVFKYADALSGNPLPESSVSNSNKGTTPQGAGQPSTEQRTLGEKILLGAPYACTPFEVAKYFLPSNLVKLYGKDAAIYSRAWPENYPYNPVVFEFLARMQYIEKEVREEGDKVDWCASFVSWCLVRAQSTSQRIRGDTIKQYRHPGARSFLCFGQQTSDPKIGDIAVWYERSETYACPGVPVGGKGHVGFFVGNATTVHEGQPVEAVTVLAGNQGFEKLKDNQWIWVKNVPLEYDGKKLTAFRTAQILHIPPSPAPCTKEMQDAGRC